MEFAMSFLLDKRKTKAVKNVHYVGDKLWNLQ